MPVFLGYYGIYYRNRECLEISHYLQVGTQFLQLFNDVILSVECCVGANANYDGLILMTCKQIITYLFNGWFVQQLALTCIPFQQLIVKNTVNLNIQMSIQKIIVLLRNVLNERCKNVTFIYSNSTVNGIACKRYLSRNKMLM